MERWQPAHHDDHRRWAPSQSPQRRERQYRREPEDARRAPDHQRDSYYNQNRSGSKSRPENRPRSPPRLHRSRSPSIGQFEFDDEEPIIEAFDSDGCLILRDKPSKTVKLDQRESGPTRHVSSSSENETSGRKISQRQESPQAPVPELCDGEAEFGCKSGCERCKNHFICGDCK